VTLGVVSYSADAADLLAASIIGSDTGLTYVDVGCLYPRRQNNTFFFYERGGSGLCIDPNPAMASEYEKHRPRDVFLNCGVGSFASTLTYYMHANPVFNTFSAERAALLEIQAQQSSRRKRIGELQVPVLTLDEAIQTTKIGERESNQVDLMSIDVEGLELEVLAGFSATMVRPRLVVIEYIRRGAMAIEDVPLVEAMREKDYWLVAFTGHDLYFCRDEDR
jgi:FkbM family methyltransferase